MKEKQKKISISFLEKNEAILKEKKEKTKYRGCGITYYKNMKIIVNNKNFMEANELRIGNSIYQIGHDYNSQGMPFLDLNDIEVVEVDIDILKEIIGSNDTTDFAYYKPIPLTEQKLLEFKFEKDKSNFINDSYVNKDLEVTIIIREDKFFLTSFFGWVELQYVHKMQNLCFELTGKELTL
jgi:hypothetical protein